MKVEMYGITDVGRKRKFNEDNFLCHWFQNSSSDNGLPLSLMIVADGIGGHAGGETASALAVQVISESLAQIIETTNSRDYQEIMKASIQEANHRIYKKASEDTTLTGMGTTLVSVLVLEGYALISNVGDSRAYLVRNQRITQITDDHSWLAEQRRLNLLSEEEISHSPFRNTITRSLGFDSAVSVDTFWVGLADNDYILLCSDGLYESISDSVILKLVLRQKRPEKICAKLIKMANKNGGHDNITAVVGFFKQIDRSRSQKKPFSDTVKIDSRLYRESGGSSPDDTVDLEELEGEIEISPDEAVPPDSEKPDSEE